MKARANLPAGRISDRFWPKPVDLTQPVEVDAALTERGARCAARRLAQGLRQEPRCSTCR